MRLLLLALLLAGCTPTVTLQLTPPSPDEVRWQRQITDTVNAHDARIEALEKRLGLKEDSSNARSAQ